MSRRAQTAAAPGAWDDMLKAVLIPNRAARVVREEPDGSLTLAVPTRKPSFFRGLINWLVRVPQERLTVLDPLGAGIWKSCDGKRSVEEIAVRFATFHHLSFHESRVSVTGYVTSLLRRGVLAVAVNPRG
ncbi:MAG TPA: PqqD family protein [Kiritimatiellia bacterium]|mgnify:FL=1|nr:PqqD family protein [Kiritimatiellia bacterium]HPJ56057.1 PqqD family protein [Kiritimatiellia bacterium]HPR68458.1 PqqD family protein [Kiritimatiellia bacterium]HRX05942.1 PqqD family protein [Kiritimatiellia bacterium]